MRRTYSLGLVFAALVALTVVGSGPGQASRWGKGYFPDVTVLTQDGKEVRFYDDLIKDKVFVISFIYTSCRDICPLVTARLTALKDKLGDAMGRDVFFYSLSIDPETDTPARLKQYADTFGTGPGWLFLTGKPEDIRAIGYKLGERSQSLSEHRNEILLGNGTTGEWARNNVLGDIDSLAMTVRGMNPAWHADASLKRADFKALKFDFASQPGQALFKRLCSGCHSVGQGPRVGPDLAGVTERRDRDWLMRYIADPKKMQRAKDPTALSLIAQFPTVRMPALGIAENDAKDLIAYIEAHQPRPSPLEALAALTDQNGQQFSLERLKDHPVAVAFGFTHCPDVCPTTLLDWSNVLDGLGPDGDRLKVLFVSVDPERDTPAALKAYLASFDPRIVALTGSPEEIAAAARAFDAFYDKVADGQGGYTFDHTVKTYLIGRDGRMAGAVDLRTPEQDRRKTIAGLLTR
jgi:protein SCO1/2